MLHISPEDFWNSTPNETYAALDYAYELKFNEYKYNAELLRLCTFTLFNTQLKEPLHNVQDLFKFSWDDEIDSKENVTEDKEVNWEEIEKKLRGE